MSRALPSRQFLGVIGLVGRGLMPAQAERLAAALEQAGSPGNAQQTVGMVPTPAFTANVRRLLQAWQQEPTVAGLAVGAAIAAAAHAHDEARRNPYLELVVSGPTSTQIHARRTEQVLLQLIGGAQATILLVTFALHMDDELRKALSKATVRGVQLTMLAEHPDDNRGYKGSRPTDSLQYVAARLLRWPRDQRPDSGAALHAKLVVVDATTALISSANLTKRAAGDNLEVGLLIRGGDIPKRLAQHFGELEFRGDLKPSDDARS